MTERNEIRVEIGSIGEKSRVYFGDQLVPGVMRVNINLAAEKQTEVVITLRAQDCFIIQSDVDG